jgi:anti-sigma factor RsiW
MHLKDNEVLDYVAERASAEHRLEMEEHFAQCDACLDRVRTLVFLRDRYDGLWDEWTARAHGSAHRKWLMSCALERLAASKPSLAERARGWLEGIGGRAELRTARILVDRARKLALAAAGAMPPGYSFALRPLVTGVGAPDKALEETVRKSADLLRDGQIEASREELVKAAEVNARLVQSAEFEVHREGTRIAASAVDGRAGRAWIRVWIAEGEQKPSFAFLCSKDDPAEYMAVEFEPVEGEEYLVAEFEDLPSGPLQIIW